MLTQMAATAAPIFQTAAQINAYFGTAALVTSGGATLFTKNYLFFSTPISPDFAAGVVTDPNASPFPILRNKITAAATFDSTLFVQEISNGTCVTAGALCDPTHLWSVFFADAHLIAALHNLPVPSGDTVRTLMDVNVPALLSIAGASSRAVTVAIH